MLLQICLIDFDRATFADLGAGFFDITNKQTILKNLRGSFFLGHHHICFDILYGDFALIQDSFSEVRDCCLEVLNLTLLEFLFALLVLHKVLMMLFNLFEHLGGFFTDNDLPYELLAADEFVAEVTVQQALLTQESLVRLAVKVQPFPGMTAAMPTQALSFVFHSCYTLEQREIDRHAVDCLSFMNGLAGRTAQLLVAAVQLFEAHLAERVTTGNQERLPHQ